MAGEPTPTETTTTEPVRVAQLDPDQWVTVELGVGLLLFFVVLIFFTTAAIALRAGGGRHG